MKENEKKENEEKKIAENKETEAAKKDAVVNSDELHVGFYTGSVLVSILIAAATTVFTFIFTAKPVMTIIEEWFGVDDRLINEFYRLSIFTQADADRQLAFAWVVAGLSVVVTVLMIFITIISTNRLKKPPLLMGIISFVISLAMVIVNISARISADKLLKDCAFESSRVPNLYDYCMIAVIVNCIAQLVCVIGIGVGKIKWDREGSAY